MPRPHAPWFRKSKNSWYVKLAGRQVALGVRGRKNRPEALEAFARLLVGVTTSTGGARLGALPLRVRDMVDAFLADARPRVGAETLRGYRKYLVPFATTYGDRSAEGVTAREAEAFGQRLGWSPTYQAGFVGTLQSAYRWAVRQRLVVSSPVENCRKPLRRSRGTAAVVTEVEHRRLLEKARPDTRDLLVMLWHTGARPGEVAGLTAEQVRASVDGVIPLPCHKTAHRGKSRVLILVGEALVVARRRAEAVGSGLLFRGQGDVRLTAQAIGCRLRKLCRRAGVRHLIPYGYRHAFATAALSAGVPDAQVAALLGHSSTTMLHRHYSHLCGQVRVLKEALARVR